MEFYYDEYNNNEAAFIDDEYVINEFGQEIPNYQQYYGAYNEEMQPPEYTLGYVQPGYDMVGYYTPPDLGYSHQTGFTVSLNHGLDRPCLANSQPI